MTASALTIVGQYSKPNGQPSVGTITFQLLTQLRSTTANEEISTSAVVATLDANGHLSVTLAASDGTYSPFVDTDYRVTQSIDGVLLEYILDVPATTVEADTPLDLPAFLQIHGEIVGAEAAVPDYATMLANQLAGLTGSSGSGGLITATDNGAGIVTLTQEA